MGDVRIIGGFNLTYFFTWFDAPYDVHPTMSSQKVRLMSMGYEILHFQSSKQNLNAKSLTEAELIRTSDYIPFHIYMVMFSGGTSI